jgi:hypothetical protein
LRNRSALWHEVFDAFGYRLSDSRPGAGPGELRVRAVRPASYGGPAAVIDVTEFWAAGADPDALGVEAEGCHLRAVSWHAQVEATGDVGAERLDLDRTKPRALGIHRHPLGEPNEVRLPAAGLMVPARWLEHVEEVIYDNFHRERR